VETQQDVGGTTTGGERVWGSIRDGRANFSMLLAAMGMDRIGTLDNAFWCWEKDAKGLGQLVRCRPSNEGVSLRPKGSSWL
jgi:hypothetical protein